MFLFIWEVLREKAARSVRCRRGGRETDLCQGARGQLGDATGGTLELESRAAVTRGRCRGRDRVAGPLRATSLSTSLSWPGVVAVRAAVSRGESACLTSSCVCACCPAQPPLPMSASSSQLLREIALQSDTDDTPSPTTPTPPAHHTQTHTHTHSSTHDNTTQKQQPTHTSPDPPTPEEPVPLSPVTDADAAASSPVPPAAVSRALSLLACAHAPLSLSLPLAASEVQLAPPFRSVSSAPWLQLPVPVVSAASSSSTSSSCLSLAVSLCVSPLPSLVAHPLSAPPDDSQRDPRSPSILDPQPSHFHATDPASDAAAAMPLDSSIPTHPPELPFDGQDEAHDERVEAHPASRSEAASPPHPSLQVAVQQSFPKPTHSQRISAASVLSMSPIALSPSCSPLPWHPSPDANLTRHTHVDEQAPVCKRALSLGPVGAVPPTALHSAVSVVAPPPPRPAASATAPVVVSAAPRSILSIHAVHAPKPRHARSVRFDLPPASPDEMEQDTAEHAPRKPRAARIPIPPLRPPPPSFLSPDIELSMQLSAEPAQHDGDGEAAMALAGASSAPLHASTTAAACAAAAAAAASDSCLFDLADGDGEASQLFDEPFFEPWMEADFGQHSGEAKLRGDEPHHTTRPCELSHSASSPLDASLPPSAAAGALETPSSSCASVSIKIERARQAHPSPQAKTDLTGPPCKLEAAAVVAVQSAGASVSRKRMLSPVLSPDPSDEHAYGDECDLLPKDELTEALHELPSDDECVPFDPPISQADAAATTTAAAAATAARPPQEQKRHPVTASPRVDSAGVPSKAVSSHYKRPRFHKEAAAAAAASGTPVLSLTATAAAAGLARTKPKARAKARAAGATAAQSVVRPKSVAVLPLKSAAGASSAVASSSSLQRSLSNFLQATPKDRPAHAPHTTPLSSRRTYAQLPTHTPQMQRHNKSTAARAVEARTETEDSMEWRETTGPGERRPQVATASASAGPSSSSPSSQEAAAGSRARSYCDLTEMADGAPSQIFLYD